MSERTFYCWNCGQVLSKVSKYCPECGAKIPQEMRDLMSEEDNHAEAVEEKTNLSGEEADQPKQAAGSSEEEGGRQGGILTKILPNMGAIIGLAIGVVFILVVLILIIRVAIPDKVDLDPYITVTCSGYNGYGSVSCDFDGEAFLADYGDEISLRVSADTSKYEMMSDDAIPAELLLANCVGYELVFAQEDQVNGQLSDGDTVTLKWNCDDSLAKNDFKIKLQHSDLEFEVENLSDPESTDIGD